MTRIGLIFGIAAAVAFIAGSILPIPCVNAVLALGSLVALGWGAGYTAAKTTGTPATRGIGRGATAGAIAGTVFLVLSIVLFLLLSNTAFFQAMFQEALEQSTLPASPTTGEPTTLDPTVAALFGGAAGGFCIGVIGLILMLIGGAVGGMMWRGVPSQPVSPGTFGSATPPSDNVRVYDTDDADRPR